MKAVYLTGAPAAGKTTALAGLLMGMPEIKVWHYSERLTAYLQRRTTEGISHQSLREQSASLVGPADIAAVDKELQDFVTATKGSQHVVIDSHPVTKEDYGFRCTPFSHDRLQRLALDEIWVLYVDPQTTVSRILADAQGRRPISLDEASMHSALQGALAIQYGISAGCPVYFFDATVGREEIVERLRQRLNK